jgi:hypothetical protein
VTYPVGTHFEAQPPSNPFDLMAGFPGPNPFKSILNGNLIPKYKAINLVRCAV